MSVVNKIFIPTLISSVDYQPVRTLPHIYFYNGMKNCEPYYIEHYSGSTTDVTASVLEKFPYVDNYDGLTPTTSSKSLLFFNETTPYGDTPTGSLYTEYWETYVSLLYNPKTRLINCSAIIPLADYFEMELNDIVQWRGNFYHLRAINQYNLKDGTCELQLLGPIIRDAAQPTIDCTFDFSSSLEFITPTTSTTTVTPTTIAPTTSTTTLTPTTSTTTLTPTTSTTTVAPPYSVEFLVVAGGGGSARNGGGGGGAGGLLSGSTNVNPSFTYEIIVGAGGAGQDLTQGSNGGNSSFTGSSYIFASASGGGGGAAGNTGFTTGKNGGSGGGAHREDTPGSGIIGQGFSGSNGRSNVSVPSNAGGGGGARTVGFACPDGYIGGKGGSGSMWLNGVIYAGGGGGGAYYTGIGGPGGGGNGGANGVFGTAGSINTGGGAGGNGNGVNGTGPNGGSGIVILRYTGSQQGTGGVVTTSGSYTYHTFTSSANFIA